MAGVKGRVAPFIVRKTQERVNFFAKQRKRENPRRGFSFLVSLCLDFFATFLKKGSAKNFTEGKVLAYILRSTVVLIKFYASGRGNPHKWELKKKALFETVVGRSDYISLLQREKVSRRRSDG